MRMIGWAPLAAWPSGAFAAPAAGEPFGAASLGQFAFGLFAVVGAILALAWVLRRMYRIQGGVQGRMRVLAGLPLGSRERVVLLQVGDEQVLLGVAPGRVSRLHVLERPLETQAAPAAEADEGFAARLAAAMRRGRVQ